MPIGFCFHYDTIRIRIAAWKSIEVVVTSCTRNAVVRKGTWVRIPPLPPVLFRGIPHHINIKRRDVAQFGSALGSGPRGRGFESRHLDQKSL